MSESSAVYDHSTRQASLCVTRSHGHATFPAEYNANQVNLAIITPPAGRRISVCGVYAATDAIVGIISLDFAVSVIPVWRHYTSRFGQAGGSGVHTEGATGEALTLNTTTGANLVFLLVNYRIID